MQDGIIAETGNSRTLRTVAGALQQYPTYESFIQALVRGEFPIDWAEIIPDGWVQQGTPLNKANLLTDATAALLNLPAAATPNDMLAALANKLNSADSKVSAAQSAASSAKSIANSALTKANGLITYSTTDLTAGSSSLATGTVYLVYE